LARAQLVRRNDRRPPSASDLPRALDQGIDWARNRPRKDYSDADRNHQRDTERTDLRWTHRVRRVVEGTKPDNDRRRQNEHGEQHGEHDHRQRGPPFPRDAWRRHQLQRPSRKPTPCTVSTTDLQPASANLALRLRMWLS